MIGKIRMVCANIMAWGVNKIPKFPSGPARESSKYTSSPTTTGGKPISVLIKTTKIFLPGNFLTTKKEPKGNPNNVAKKTDVRLIFKLKKIISYKEKSSPVKRSIISLSSIIYFNILNHLRELLSNV